MKRLALSILLLAIVMVAASAITFARTHRGDPQGGDSAIRVEVGPNILASANVDSGGRNECWVTASKKDVNFLVGVCQAQQVPGNQRLRVPGGAPLRFQEMAAKLGARLLCLSKTRAVSIVMVASAPDGRVYLSQPMMGRNFSLGSSTSTATRQKGTIRIYSTTDQGTTWRGPVELDCPIAEDHPRIVVDDSNGPHRGRFYVEWNEVSDTIFDNTYHIVLQYSDDGGQTFSDAKLIARTVSEGGKLVATEPIVLSDGTLLVTYYQYWNPLSDPRNDHQPFYIVRSADGGKTFEEPRKIIEVGPSAWLYLRRDMSRAFTLPIITADTSSSSKYRDNIYITWQDISSGNADIRFVSSTDKGETWSSPLRVNDNKPSSATGPFEYRVTPVVAVNKDGVVGVAWYDYRGNDPANLCWRQYFAASIDGGRSF